MISLRSRLSFMKGLALSAATRANLSGSSRGSPADALGDLRVTVRASLPGTPPRTSYSSRSEHPVRFPGDFAGLSHGAPSISFGAPSADRMSIAASGMGSRPLRMKVQWGCHPRVLSPLPHRTQSWRPCLPGQPWASGWRSTDRPVCWPPLLIGFSERGAAHNRALPRCLSSRRCMRSWRVRGWPLSRPEAARPPPPSSLPSTAEWPGGTRAFPRWRARSRCTCAHETPPLGGTVRVSRPRPVSWPPLSRPKLTVLQARQPPPCTPWLSCRFTKPRRSNRCTRVVPTRGWCRSCARATDFALRSSDESHGAVPREGDVHHGGPGAPSLAQPGRDEGRRQSTLSRRPHLPGRAVRRHRRGLRPAFLGGTAADGGDPAHPAPAWCTIHRCPRGQASVCPLPWAPSCVLQSCSTPGRIDT